MVGGGKIDDREVLYRECMVLWKMDNLQLILLVFLFFFNLFFFFGRFKITASI